MNDQTPQTPATPTGAASELDDELYADMPEFFHELTDDQWGKLCNSGAQWGETANRFKQPPWCGYPDAVDPLGCWSLVGRTINQESDCGDCDLHKAHNVQIHQTAESGEAACSRSGGMQG